MNEKMSTVCKTIPILNDYISDLIKENMDCLQQCAETDLELDLSK